MPYSFKKLFLILSLAAFAAFVMSALAGGKSLNKTSSSYAGGYSYDYHESGFFELKDIIEKSFLPETNTVAGLQMAQIGITSHHLPTALSFISEFYKHLLTSQGPREIFVVLGPDHSEKCYFPASLTKKSYMTPFGVLDVENEITDALLNAGAGIDDECFKGEHSIGVQTVFIKHLFPEAKIVPLTFSATAEDDMLVKIADVLEEYKNKITVIASVDFSHHFPYDEAVRKDDVSLRMITGLNGGFLTLEYVDSPASVKLAVLLAKKLNFEQATILGRANSYDFTGQAENTTGYINAFFTENKNAGDTTTLMFVGDVMLSRSVGDKMKKTGDERWPFLKIAEYLKEADLLFGNLEGPISDRGANVGSIYSFRADPKVIEGLKYAGFDILSVANNHIGDWGREAMKDTFHILGENGISYAGGGFNENEAHAPIIKEVKGTKFAFLAYTALGAGYTKAVGEQSGIAWLDIDRMKNDITQAKEQSDIVIVSFHFGEEYQTEPNQHQKNTARSAVDAGASLVIGHHPHIAQEIEKYNEGYIAYSLGNFIFDQFFSKETMSGLLIKVSAHKNKIQKVESIKTNISQQLQVEIK